MASAIGRSEIIGERPIAPGQVSMYAHPVPASRPVRDRPDAIFCEEEIS